MKRFLPLFLLFALLPAVGAIAQDQADQLMQQVQMARTAGDFEKAILLNDQEILLRRQDPYSSKLYLANSLHTQASNYAALQNYDRAIAIEEEALALFRKTDKKKRFIGVSLNNLGVYHFSRGHSGDYAKAEAYAEEALRYKKSGTESYVNTLNLLVVYQTAAGHPAKANELSKKLFKQGKRVYGVHTVNYAAILSNQSIKLANLGNFSEAIRYAEESASIYQAEGDTMNLSYARLLINTANYYSNKEDYRTSVERLERARQILLSIEGEGGLNYIQCTGELSAAYNHLGDLQKADDLAYAAQSGILNTNDERTTLVKAQSLKKQAEVFANNGNYRVAASLQNIVVNIYAQYADSLGMANAYDRLSNYYYHVGDLQRAIECSQQSIGLYTRNDGKQGDLAQAYNSMSIYYYHQGDTQVALQYATNATDLYTAAGDTVSSFYAKALANTALYHYAAGHSEEALRCALHSYDLQQKVLGESHPDNVINLFNIAHYYYSLGDEPHMQSYLHEALQLQADLVRKNFSHMTTAGREMYWNSKRFVFSVLPTYAFLCADNDSLLLDAYNAQLFTKGILLNSEIDFKSLLIQSGDSLLLEEYMSLGDLNNQIADIYAASSKEEGNAADRSRELERLKKKATALERDLMRRSKEYGDYTTNMSITAQDIAASLNEDDVAVELFEIPVSGGKAYYAMYLKKDWKAPRLVKLFSHLDLRGVEHNGGKFEQLFHSREGVDYLFSNSGVGQMVWNPLIQSWGDGVRNIYFSPSGLFYQWGIEYLQLGDGQRVNDRYNVRRLSSTKMLAQRDLDAPLQNAAVFGGFNYDMSVDDMAAMHQNFGTYTNNLVTIVSDEDLTAQRSFLDVSHLTDSLSREGGIFINLPGTRIEAEAIGEQLMQNNIATDMYLHNEGIEENFKALSGNPHSLIHIATHGFSFTDRAEAQLVLSSAFDEGWTATTGDANLNYSGLAFSGANNAVKHDGVPNGVEDGILTSREISLLDLRGTELVVLSACQTGLGAIKEDGVFGMQRGFKKAGAQTLLMSLWSVNDAATMRMMTAFYQALTEGASRHEAFKRAQNQVRSNPNFAAPYFWASFIMLDDM